MRSPPASRSIEGKLADEPVPVEPQRATGAQDGHGHQEGETALYPFLEGTHNADQSRIICSCALGTWGDRPSHRPSLLLK